MKVTYNYILIIGVKTDILHKFLVKNLVFEVEVENLV